MPENPAGPSNALSRIPLFQGIRPLRWSEVPKNLLAGVTLAAMNIPQSLGYTKIAGTPVITGLYTLLLPLIAFATFGSSRYLVVAADSATAAILAGGLSGMAPLGSERYVALAGLVALLTGILLLIARMLKLGFLADFLSQTVLVGFLTGVGFQVGIAVSGGMLGLEIHSRRTPAQFLEVVRSLRQVPPLTLEISFAVVAGILILSWLAPKFPTPLFAVAGAIAASAAFHWGDRGVKLLGPVPGGLPHLGLPDVSWKDLEELLPVALCALVMIVAQSAEPRAPMPRAITRKMTKIRTWSALLQPTPRQPSAERLWNGAPRNPEWWKAPAAQTRSRISPPRQSWPWFCSS